MKELEDLISSIGSDALKNQMQLYNAEKLGEFDEEGDDGKLRMQEIKILEEKERQDREAEEAKRQ